MPYASRWLRLTSPAALIAGVIGLALFSILVLKVVPNRSGTEVTEQAMSNPDTPTSAEARRPAPTPDHRAPSEPSPSSPASPTHDWDGWPSDAAAVSPFDADQAARHQKAWAQYLGVTVEKEIDLGNSVKLTMVLIPPGEFLMGSTAEEQSHFLDEARAANDTWASQRIPSEGPQHRVGITKPFWLSRYEVTVAQFRRFSELAEYKTDAERDGAGGYAIVDGHWTQDSRFVWSGDLRIPQTENSPVVIVSWFDVMACCAWLSKQQNGLTFAVPTEAQWEYACRAGTTTYWHCGDSEAALQEYGWILENPRGGTHPVGQLRPNGFGLHDMHGNASEWCVDWFAANNHAISPAEDPTGRPSGSYRVFRGGSCTFPARNCRSACRGGLAPHDRIFNVGFRLAATMDQFEPLGTKSKAATGTRSADPRR